MLWNLGSAIGRLVSPPAVLLLLTALGLWHVRKKWGVRLAWLSILLLWLAATPIVAYGLLDLLTHGATPVDVGTLPKSGAMIVILPAGKVRAREYQEGETASPLTVQRVRYGVTLAKATGLLVAIPGGKHRGVHSEAELARRFAETELDYRVALIEEASLDTRQSALNLVAPLRGRGVKAVVLVTDARHMPRAAEAFAKVGFDVVRAPMAITAGESQLMLLAFVPTAEALVASFDVTHELVGRLWYAVRSLLSGAA
jgi:uncharacterized SAM-binding protein YcdF (DUF218 family)